MGYICNLDNAFGQCESRELKLIFWWGSKAWFWCAYYLQRWETPTITKLKVRLNGYLLAIGLYKSKSSCNDEMLRCCYLSQM